MRPDMPEGVSLYGDTSYRGKCPTEDVEQASIVNMIRRQYPDTWGRLVIHPRNEGLVSRGQFSAVIKHRAEGMTPGASDIIVPGSPSFVCEMKRRNIQLSQWQDGQREYLEAAAKAGCFACVALGAMAAWDAFREWIYASQAD